MSVIDIAPSAPARSTESATAPPTRTSPAVEHRQLLSRYVPATVASIEELVARDIEAYSLRRRGA